MAVKEHLPYLDGWRGLAILGVLWGHFAKIEGTDPGRLGVDLFFVLSGLLMARILFEQRMPLKTFYWRRFSRIVPAFLVFVTVILVGSWLAGMPVTKADVLATPVFLRSYFGSDIWDSPLAIGHLWSLNVEEHAYLVLSILSLLWARGWMLIALGLGCIAMRFVYVHFGVEGNVEVRTEVAASLILLSAGYRQVKLTHVPKWAPLVAIALALPAYLGNTPWQLRIILPPILLAFAVNHIGETYRSVRSALEWKPLTMIGLWSFSIYLWQHPFYKAHEQLGMWALVLAMTTGLASFYLLEKPMRKWLNSVGFRAKNATSY